MSTVPIVFCRQHHPGSVLLRAFLWSAWSHCAIVDGQTVIEASARHGVRERPLADLLAESSRVELVTIQTSRAEAVLAAARTQIGKPYDWPGVLGIGFRRRWQDSDSWFCSELVAWAFHTAGCPLFRLDAWRVTPRDLYAPLFGGRAAGVPESEVTDGTA